MMKELEELVRPNIWRLKPYSSARDEYSGHEAHVFLDANENPFNTTVNRYPDPLQRDLKQVIAKVKNVAAEQIFLGNGSDEAIDLCYRCFTEPGKDNVVAIEPTYGMYRVCADINDVEYRAVLMNERFEMNASDMLDACDEHTKLIWICSPNNPSGNSINSAEILTILDTFPGIVVVDEAYGDFTQKPSFRTLLNRYPNLIVLNTMSKAWGAAAIRMGMAFASKDIIDIFNKVKYPYNVNQLTQNKALELLKDPFQTHQWVRMLIQERNRVIVAFQQLPLCVKVYPTDANFFLAEVNDAQAIYNYLMENGIIVRNRNRVAMCGNCLRITVGTRNENNELLGALRKY